MHHPTGTVSQSETLVQASLAPMRRPDSSGSHREESLQIVSNCLQMTYWNNEAWHTRLIMGNRTGTRFALMDTGYSGPSKEKSVNITRRLLRLSIALLVAGVLLAPMASRGQDSATKRKVSRRVVPDYPKIARDMNITGKVKLEAIVEPDGHVKTVRPVGGSPLLVESAEQALKNWKFETGPKETTEIIEFDFGQQ
jgi:TonB family protein